MSLTVETRVDIDEWMKTVDAWGAQARKSVDDALFEFMQEIEAELIANAKRSPNVGSEYFGGIKIEYKNNGWELSIDTRRATTSMDAGSQEKKNYAYFVEYGSKNQRAEAPLRKAILAVEGGLRKKIERKLIKDFQAILESKRELGRKYYKEGNKSKAAQVWGSMGSIAKQAKKRK